MYNVICINFKNSFEIKKHNQQKKEGGEDLMITPESKVPYGSRAVDVRSRIERVRAVVGVESQPTAKVNSSVIQ